MFGSWREKLETVQQDLATSLKTLADSKEAKVKRNANRFEVPQFSAGLELLNRYEENWVLLHRRIKDCASIAEQADGEAVMMMVHWERRQNSLKELQEQLGVLPSFISQLDAITARIAQLEGDFEEMDSRLMYLELLCCRCEQQKFKEHHRNQLEIYKKKKRKELETLKAELDTEHAQKVAELELATQQKMKERQKVYEEAFNLDMETYLSTGYLQLTGPVVCAEALDQMSLTDVSDQEALDHFLNSTGDDISTASSLTSGPDVDSWSSASISQAVLLDDQPANQDSVSSPEEEEAASDSSDGPLVQSDEEDIQADTSLVLLPEPGPIRSSDDSDSAGDQPPG